MLQLGYLWLWVLIIIFFCWNNVVVVMVIEGRQVCVNTTFDCGNVKNFTYPFWLINTTAVKLKESHCGYPNFGINCSTGNPILAFPNNVVFSVKSIDFVKQRLTVIDLDFLGKSCPRVHRKYEFVPPFYWDKLTDKTVKYYSNCVLYPPSSVPYISCLGSTGSNRSYVFEFDAVPNFNWDKYCDKPFKIPVLSTAPNISKDVSNYGSILQLGFRIGWQTPLTCLSCENLGGKCGFDPKQDAFLCVCQNFTATIGDTFENCKDNQETTTIAGSNDTRIKKTIIGVSGVAALVLIILLVYILVYKRKMYSHCCQICRWNRNNTNVEVFLEDYGRLTPYRYRYSELKRITNFFKDKLGQGGYGGVFKGMLKDGRLVAVKVLTESKGTGEEFINEVATIGRTNHVNVVSLLGYCSQGPKRALVYEFMPNGSLEKFIYNDKSTSTKHPLGWDKSYQIALGIANGLEYLHRGCNTRILHFDIKPHNILLDEDFCPKISDFGLAKLCTTRDGIVSMLGTRGTIGYIAPEVYCRNFGGVSPKSDVYSYGMMLLEMVGGRKNIDATVENTSEIYFPQWIYNHLEQHESIGLGGFKEMFEEENIKKMIIVGLWCIQIHPVNRPSMSTVVEMLQKSVEDLQMPPNPFQDRESSQSTSGSSCSARSTSTSHK